MSDEDAVARGMAFMNGFDENHPTLKGVAQVLGTSKLTRWPDASDYAGTGKYMYQAELAGVAVAVQVVPLHPPEDAGWKIERAQRRVSLLPKSTLRTWVECSPMPWPSTVSPGRCAGSRSSSRVKVSRASLLRTRCGTWGRRTQCSSGSALGWLSSTRSERGRGPTCSLSVAGSVANLRW